MRYLLDTHILLWWFLAPDRLSAGQRRALDDAEGAAPLYVSNVTLWEVATLVSLGRVELDLPVRDWLERATAPPLVRRVAISPAIAAEVASLPDTMHRDPADRILVSTARVEGLALVTSDARISDSGLVRTVA